MLLFKMQRGKLIIFSEKTHGMQKVNFFQNNLPLKLN
jgi:hypothetical protein